MHLILMLPEIFTNWRETGASNMFSAFSDERQVQGLWNHCRESCKGHSMDYSKEQDIVRCSADHVNHSPQMTSLGLALVVDTDCSGHYITITHKQTGRQKAILKAASTEKALTCIKFVLWAYGSWAERPQSCCH